MSEWWVQEQGGRPSGPLATGAVAQAIVDGRMPPSALVCSVVPGSRWAPADSVPQLAAAIARTRPQRAGQAAPRDEGGGYGGYAPVRRQEAAPEPEEQRPAAYQAPQRAPTAMIFTAILCFYQLGVFGTGFVLVNHVVPLGSLEGITMLTFMFALPFVSAAFYGWATWGIAQYRARAYRRAMRAHLVFAITTVLAGLFAILTGRAIIGVILMSSILLFGLCAWLTRRARGEFKEDEEIF